MITKGIASGLASGLAGGKGGSSLRDHDIKEESRRSGNHTAALTNKTGTVAPSVPTSQRSGASNANQRLAHIRANYPRPEMFIKNGKLVLKNKN